VSGNRVLLKRPRDPARSRCLRKAGRRLQGSEDVPGAEPARPAPALLFPGHRTSRTSPPVVAANPDAAGAARPANPVSRPAGEGTEYSAVESPRGRLYDRLVTTSGRTLLAARVLAPTAWNFHPSGPLVRALTGFCPNPDPAAAIAVRDTVTDA
jgi:hypothetical protein